MIRSRAAWILLAPFLGGVVVLLFLPAIANLGYAATDHVGFGTPEFTGLDNLRRMTRDPFFQASLRASLAFAALAVPLRLLAATIFGLALAPERRGSRWQRAAVYLPTVLPDIALSLTFLWVFNPLYGPLNGVLGAAGLPQPVWFSTGWGARWAIVIMMVFPIGEAFLVVMAGRRSLATDIYEAAQVDGASPWQTLWRITLPQMAPLLILLAVRDTILSLQVNFVPAYLLTDGKPDSATLFMPVYIFDQAFELLGFGYGAAMTVLLLAVTTILILIQLRIGRRWLRPNG